MFEEKENAAYSPEVVTEEEAAPQAETAEVNPKYIVKFKKPYRFEGRDYTEVDLSGLERLTVKDAIEVQRDLFSQQEIGRAHV